VTLPQSTDHLVKGCRPRGEIQPCCDLEIESELRIEAALTQEALAYECGCSKGYLSDFEAERRLSSLSYLAELARRLELPIYNSLVVPNAGDRSQLVEWSRRARDDDLARALRAAFDDPDDAR